MEAGWRLVGVPPAAGVDVQIVAADLQKDSQWFGFGLADQYRVFVAAPQSDISANSAEDSAKRVGPFLCCGERTDGSRTASRNAMVVRGIAEFLCFRNFLKRFFDQKSRVEVAHAVVFEGAVEARLGAFGGGGDDAGVDEETDGDVVTHHIRLKQTQTVSCPLACVASSQCTHNVRDLCRSHDTGGRVERG